MNNFIYLLIFRSTVKTLALHVAITPSGRTASGRKVLLDLARKGNKSKSSLTVLEGARSTSRGAHRGRNGGGLL